MVVALEVMAVMAVTAAALPETAVMEVPGVMVGEAKLPLDDLERVLYTTADRGVLSDPLLMTGTQTGLGAGAGPA